MAAAEKELSKLEMIPEAVRDEYIASALSYPDRLKLYTAAKEIIKDFSQIRAMRLNKKNIAIALKNLKQFSKIWRNLHYLVVTGDVSQLITKINSPNLKALKYISDYGDPNILLNSIRGLEYLKLSDRLISSESLLRHEDTLQFLDLNYTSIDPDILLRFAHLQYLSCVMISFDPLKMARAIFLPYLLGLRLIVFRPPAGTDFDPIDEYKYQTIWENFLASARSLLYFIFEGSMLDTKAIIDLLGREDICPKLKALQLDCDPGQRLFGVEDLKRLLAAKKGSLRWLITSTNIWTKEAQEFAAEQKECRVVFNLPFGDAEFETEDQLGLRMDFIYVGGYSTIRPSISVIESDPLGNVKVVEEI